MKIQTLFEASDISAKHEFLPTLIPEEPKIDAFFEFIEDCEIPVHSIDIETAKKAAEIRAVYKNFKTMDCLQIASACVMDCDLFLTNDNQLRQFQGIKCLTVEDIMKSK